jgi:hypothetical protein
MAAALAVPLGLMLVSAVLVMGGCAFSDEDFRIIGSWRCFEENYWEEWTLADGGRFSFANSEGISFEATWTFDSGSNVLTVCQIRCESITVGMIDDNTLFIDGDLYYRQ